jgi:hypothetical protein
MASSQTEAGALYHNKVEGSKSFVLIEFAIGIF